MDGRRAVEDGLGEGEEEVGSKNLEAFLVANREMLKCDMDFLTGGNPSYYTEYHTNYPYQDMGEATWEEYLAFKAEDSQKLHPNQARKR